MYIFIDMWTFQVFIFLNFISIYHLLKKYIKFVFKMNRYVMRKKGAALVTNGVQCGITVIYGDVLQM
jgi:hypothetical protein